MIQIAHLSDLHFGRAGAGVALDLLKDLEKDPPQLIAISGDLTQRARSSQFHDARAFLDSLPSPFLVVPGNHDIPLWNLFERVFSPFKKYRKFISNDLNPYYEAENLQVVGLNSVRRFAWFYDWSRGRVSREQLRHAGRIFDQAPGRAARVIVVHHPFLLPEGTGHRGLIGGAKAALQLFDQWNVDLVLSGHLHWSASGPVVSGTAPGISTIIIAQAGTSISDRLKEESNAYYRIHIQPHRILIETRQHGEHKFQSVETKIYERVSNRFNASSQ